jgi:hypothetical protein
VAWANTQTEISISYAWLKEPLSQRALEDARKTELIHQAWIDSGKVYGYRKLPPPLSADCKAIACRAMDVGIAMIMPWQKASSSF